MENGKRDFFDGVPSKTSFIFGTITGIAVISVVALATILLSGFTLSQALGSSLPKSNGLQIAPPTLAPSAANAPSPSAPTGTVPPVTDTDHILGDKKAPVTFIEYSDFECPFCKRFEPTMQQMMKEYAGKVRLIYRHFPLSFHANAEKEAEASECAADLGGNDAFWKYHNAILDRTTSNGTGFALDALVPLAKEIGLNEAKFKDCLDTGKFTKRVQDEASAGGSAGITGTPGSFIIDKNGSAQSLTGAVPFESIKTAIDAALAK